MSEPNPEQETAAGANGLTADAGSLARAESAERQRDEYLSMLKQTQAEFQNAQRRAARDTEAALKFAHEKLARDLLPAFDNLDRALEAARQSDVQGPLIEGVAATRSQFLDALRRHGVAPIDAAPGTPFDPNRHEAVMSLASDQPAGTVAQVFQQGFLIHDRVLRPAGVVVSTGPEA